MTRKQGRKVIARTNMPVRLPIWQTVTMMLVFDRFGAPGWLWGVALTLVAVQFVALYAVHRREMPVDMFDPAPPARTTHKPGAPFVYTETKTETEERGFDWNVTLGGHA